MSSSKRYTREVLAEAAARCRSLDEVIAHLGTEPHDRLGRYLKGRFAAFGIDISHFRAARRGREGRPAPEELREAVTSSQSYAQTLRRLGVSCSNTTLKRWIREDGLSTAHFTGQAHMKGRAGATRPASDILVQHEGTRRTRTHLLRRALREIGIPECCAMCGTAPEWLGQPMTLEVDHVNGDWSDDRAENLRLLCPNCHAVTDTWCRGGPRRKPVAPPGGTVVH
ncbi:HNH endonuclease signature motif containing protein [Streptomyces sp. NPDC047718]|uniref:HNH endonuclease signature motif containing protein n=1 Tax=Streptomyces sp. NPDC047718 TaxID=3155479 RepID=UPI0033CFBE58